MLKSWLLSLAISVATTTSVAANNFKWVDIWGTMPQLTEPANLPPAPFNGSSGVFVDATLRQTLQVTLPANQIRVRLSNVFGATVLPITGMTIASLTSESLSLGTGAIDTNTLLPITFSGNSSITIPTGAQVVSDPIAFPVVAKGNLSLSLYLQDGQQGFAVTSHPGSRTTSWMGTGNQTAEYNLTTSDVQSTAHWYFITAIEGWVESNAGALVVVGDSITDGRGSTTNGNDRWPDQLVTRLKAEGKKTRAVSVINQAAGGNRVLADGLGPNALGRIDRDVLARSGVKYAMIYEGVNDIGTAANTTEAQQEVGDRLIQAFDQIVTRVHAQRIPIFGATITPFSGNVTIQAYSSVEREVTRQRVNEWIRNSGRFDYVVDFDAVIRDPNEPSRLAPQYDSGDYLHPNPLAYVKMAEAFDLGVFERFKEGVEGYD
jgi:lysophospholipase L1-like esterase